MLQGDRVRVNDAVERDAKRSMTLSDHVTISKGTARENLDPRVVILHQDPGLIVINKASGLLTVASPTEKDQTAEAFLNSWLGATTRGTPRVHVVHRLDRDSSGILLFARDSDMRDRLKALFAIHDIDRVYTAVVHGTPADRSGSFRSFLAEDRSLRVQIVGSALEGKEAITHYKVLDSGARYSMLEVTLETGRRNQIRVQLAAAGHPIVGDTMYGKGLDDPLGRLALHAGHLGFVHPGTGRKIKFDVALPEEIRRLML
jgi:23S rRNA pseudouridine1911/1915/1917 synthase